MIITLPENEPINLSTENHDIYWRAFSYCKTFANFRKQIVVINFHQMQMAFI